MYVCMGHGMCISVPVLAQSLCTCNTAMGGFLVISHDELIHHGFSRLIRALEARLASLDETVECRGIRGITHNTWNHETGNHRGGVAKTVSTVVMPCQVSVGFVQSKLEHVFFE